MKWTLLALWVIAPVAPCRAQAAEDPPPTDSGLTPGFADTLKKALLPYIIAIQVDQATACIPDEAVVDKDQARQYQQLVKVIGNRLDKLKEELREVHSCYRLSDRIFTIRELLADAARVFEACGEISRLESQLRQVQDWTAAILEKYPCAAPDPPERPRTP